MRVARDGSVGAIPWKIRGAYRRVSAVLGGSVGRRRGLRGGDGLSSGVRPRPRPRPRADAAFVRADRLAEIGDADGFIPLAPDVAVEVISPSDRYAELDEKIADWLDAGTSAVVVANPRRRKVSVHRQGAQTVTLGEGDILEVGDAAPGWRMAVSDIFA